MFPESPTLFSLAPAAYGGRLEFPKMRASSRSMTLGSAKGSRSSSGSVHSNLRGPVSIYDSNSKPGSRESSRAQSPRRRSRSAQRTGAVAVKVIENQGRLHTIHDVSISSNESPVKMAGANVVDLSSPPISIPSPITPAPPATQPDGRPHKL